MKNRRHNLPRANFRQKVEVLDYMAQHPALSQLKVLRHFKDLHKFSISQATLSTWKLKESEIRKQYAEHPNLEEYRRQPVYKYPEVTSAVSEYINKLANDGTIITNVLLKKAFERYLVQYGHSPKVSGGMIAAFKKRNAIKQGRLFDSAAQIKDQSISPKDDGTTNISRTDIVQNNPQYPEIRQAMPAVGVRGSQNSTSASDDSSQVAGNRPVTATSSFSQLSGNDSEFDINIEQFLKANNGMGFNTRLIHSDDSFPEIIPGMGSFTQNGYIGGLLGSNYESALTADQLTASNGETETRNTQATVIQDNSNNNQEEFKVEDKSNGSASHAVDDKVQSKISLTYMNRNDKNPSNTYAIPNTISRDFSEISPETKYRRLSGPEEKASTNIDKSSKLPYYPTYQSPMQYRGDIYERHQRPYILENFAQSRTSRPNSEKVEKILENITDGYVTIYNSGTSAIMGILSYLNPPVVCINNSGYQGTHQVINLLSKLTGVKKKNLEETDQLLPKSVILLETPMNPEGYLLDINKFANLAHKKQSYLLVDSTLAPPPLQFPFKFGADYIVYSAVKYLAGVSDLSAGFVVSKLKKDKMELHRERFALGTNIANFDSFLLLRSLRTYKMRILTQCSNTKKVIHYLRKHLDSYSDVVTKLHHSSLQTNNNCFQTQLNGYYNPVFALEFKARRLAEAVLTRFNFLSNNPNLEGGETLVELTFKNPNFVDSQADHETRSNLLRFSIGCEDYIDIIRDINQALESVKKSLSN